MFFMIYEDIWDKRIGDILMHMQYQSSTMMHFWCHVIMCSMPT